MTRPFPTSKRRVLKTHGRLLAELAEAERVRTRPRHQSECPARISSVPCECGADELRAEIRETLRDTAPLDAAGKDGR